MLRLAAVAALLALRWGAADAHALLDHAEPRVGSTVATPPAAVSLWFSQKIEPAFSSIEVRDGEGNRVDEGGSRRDGSDPTGLITRLKPIPDGTYKVHWRVLSGDTHVTEGHFSFRVGR